MMNFREKNTESKNTTKEKTVGHEQFEDSKVDLELLEFERHRAGTAHTIFNIIKLFLGISILAGPHSYKMSGLIGGAVGVASAGVLNCVTVAMQAKAWNEVDPSIRSYSELGRAVYGRKFKLFIDLFILLLQFGLWISYLLFSGTQIDQLLCIYSEGSMWGNKTKLIWISTFLILPLWMLKHMKHLAYVAIVFLIGMIFTYFTIIYSSLKLIYNGEGHYHEIKMFDPYNYPFFFGIAILSFEGNPTSLNIRASMEEPNKFNRNFLFSAAIVVIFTITVAVVGYIAFGDSIQDIALLNLPDNGLTWFVRVLYCIWLLGSYPFQMFAAIDIIENYTLYRWIPNAENFDVKYYLGRTIFVWFSGLIASIIPHFGLFLDFIGASGGTMLCFIFPVILYEKVMAGRVSTSQRILNIFIFTVGVVFGGSATVLSFIALILEID